MNPYNSADVYKKVEVNTCNRLKLVVMIYESAIASLKEAEECNKRNDMVKRNQFISRAQFIVSELNNSLDTKNGGEIAVSLRKLYHFLNRHLNSALNDNNIKKVEESLKILQNLHEAWEHINQKNLAEKGIMQNSSDNAAFYHPTV